MNGATDSGPSWFEREFEAAGPALLAWARLRVRTELRASFDPEDLVQEVGCRALAAYASFEPARASFRQWLFGIANRTLLEALRDLGRSTPGNPIAFSNSGAIDIAAKVTSITARVSRDDLVRVFLERIERLETDDRALLIHRGIEQLGHPQVATVLGLSEETVRKRWQRLCERLRNDPVFAALGSE